MRLAGVLVILTLFLTAAGCGAPAVQQETTLERARRQGFVTVGFANENPYAYATPDGQLTGEAVEVARAVLQALGINEMVPVLTEFSSLIPGLQAGRFDMITAGMFIKPERCEQVAFANPEYRVGGALAVKSGNPLNLKSYADIAANPEAKVAVMGGAIEADYMAKSGVAEGQMVVVPDQPAALAALKAGRVHAITMTGPALQAVLAAGDSAGVERVLDFKQPVIDGKEEVGYGATAFRKEDNDFREAFNRELERLQESGELLEIIRPFGFGAPELPGAVTAAALCQG